MASENANLDTLLGSAVYAFAHGLIASGFTPSDAVSRVGFAIIDGTLGRDATRSLGIPRQTAARWRREIAAAAEKVADLDESALQLDAMNALLPALGMRDLRMTRTDEA